MKTWMIETNLRSFGFDAASACAFLGRLAGLGLEHSGVGGVHAHYVHHVMLGPQVGPDVGGAAAVANFFAAQVAYSREVVLLEVGPHVRLGLSLQPRHRASHLGRRRRLILAGVELDHCFFDSRHYLPMYYTWRAPIVD